MKTHDIKAPDFTRPVFVKLEAWGSLLTVSLDSSWHRKTAHLDVKRINEHPRLEIPPRLVCWRCTRHLIPSTGWEGVRKSRTSSHGCLSARANGKCGASSASLGGFERVGGRFMIHPFYLCIIRAMKLIFDSTCSDFALGGLVFKMSRCCDQVWLTWIWCVSCPSVVFHAYWHFLQFENNYTLPTYEG